MTATEIPALDLQTFAPSERRLIAAWTLSKAGGKLDGGDDEIFVPNAVRRLGFAARLRLAMDPRADAAWEELERRRVIRSPVYFTEAYGHVQPPTGAPLPFDLWPLVERAAELAVGARTQAEVLDVLWREKRVLMLKARQLGMTWLVLHYAYWVMAFRADTPKARVLALSKHGGEAAKLLERVRRIRELLPPFLRHEEAKDTRGSKSELQLEGRGKIQSLAGDPAAARSETATLAIVDEAGFIRNAQAGDTLTALQPTIGETGQEIILSTGNGKSGDGQAFAEEVEKAIRGESDRYFLFLPADTDPARASDEWRATARKRYRSDEDFAQEQPRTVDDALGGEGAVKIYPAAHLRACAEIGRALAAVDEGRFLEQVARAEGIEWGIDWGDFQTFASYAVGLPRGGLLVVGEKLQGYVEPLHASNEILDLDPMGLVERTGARRTKSNADLAPPGTNRTFARALAARKLQEPGRWPETHVKVPFGVYKEGGGAGKKGVDTVGYLRHLAQRSYEFTQAPGWEERVAEVGEVLAIVPGECETLLRQMQDIEKDPKTGKVRKIEPDPKRPELGDHGPDSLVALAHKRASKWMAAHPGADGNDEQKAA